MLNAQKSVLASMCVSGLALTACSQQVSQDIAATPEAQETVALVKSVASMSQANGAETLGFAFDYFWFAIHETPQDCPEGLAMALRDVAIMHLPADRQEFLLKAENRSTYYKMGYALSAKRMKETGGVSVCNVPEKYDDPPHRVVQSSVSYGRDLDGVASDGSDDASCGTSDFVGPDGQGGIDNELYRILGCVDSYRRTAQFAGGAFEDYHVGAYRDGEVTTLLEIRDVDDRRNDDDVTVGVYSSIDPTPYDARKEGIPYGSMTVTTNKLWHNEVKGRIVDGELITDKFDLRLKFGFVGRPAEYLIKDSQIHLTIAEDGTAKGDLAGFFDTRHAYQHTFHDAAGAFQVANGFTCPSVWKAMWEHSDGHKDPETGQCTSISTALTISAVPAFLIHPREEELEYYVMDTRDYYGVSLEEIAVEGAELRQLIKSKRVGQRDNGEKRKRYISEADEKNGLGDD